MNEQEQKTKVFAIAYYTYQTIEKGRNKGKRERVLKHDTFTGTFEELEDYINNNGYELVGYDF